MEFIDFVFIDRNCKVMLKTKDEKFLGFSSKIEFMTLATLIEAGLDQEERYENKYADYLMEVTPNDADVDEVDENDEGEESGSYDDNVDPKTSSDLDAAANVVADLSRNQTT